MLIGRLTTYFCSFACNGRRHQPAGRQSGGARGAGKTTGGGAASRRPAKIGTSGRQPSGLGTLLCSVRTRGLALVFFFRGNTTRKNRWAVRCQSNDAAHRWERGAGGGRAGKPRPLTASSPLPPHPHPERYHDHASPSPSPVTASPPSPIPLHPPRRASAAGSTVGGQDGTGDQGPSPTVLRAGKPSQSPSRRQHRRSIPVTSAAVQHTHVFASRRSILSPGYIHILPPQRLGPIAS